MSVVFLYVLSQFILQDAFCKIVGLAMCHKFTVGKRRTTKFAGSISWLAHVPGQPDVAYELPAQSPQKVISCSAKASGEFHDKAICRRRRTKDD